MCCKTWRASGAALSRLVMPVDFLNSFFTVKLQHLGHCDFQQRLHCAESL